jgi:hypothetical protein
MMTDEGRAGMLYHCGDESSLEEALVNCMSLDMDRVRTKVLNHFKHHLSFEANVAAMMSVIQH